MTYWCIFFKNFHDIKVARRNKENEVCSFSTEFLHFFNYLECDYIMCKEKQGEVAQINLFKTFLMWQWIGTKKVIFLRKCAIMKK